MKRILPKGDFSKNVLTLLTGTTIAQVIPLLLTPVLARLYSPEDFGLLALFVSINAILFTVICLRYDMAIMLPEKNDDSVKVISLCITIATILSLFLFILALFFATEISIFLNNINIKNWLYVIPFLVFMMAFNRILTFWFNRQNEYKVMSYAKIFQHTGIAGAQSSLSIFKGGLIYGYFFGVIFSFFYLVKEVLKADITLKFKKKELIQTAKEYQELPKYSLAGALANNVASQVPTLMIAKFFSDAILGVYNLAYRMITAPLLLITTALSQVVFQKITSLSHSAPDKLCGFVVKGVCTLLILFSPLIPLMYFGGEELFVFVFGEVWRDAGTYASYLSVAVVLQLSISPFSTVLLIKGNVKIGVMWQLLYFLSIITTLYISSNYSIEKFLLILAIHEVTLYTLYFFFIIVGCKKLQVKN